MTDTRPLSTRISHYALSMPAGLSIATALFGAEAIDQLPKLPRGRNRGKPKDWLCMRRAIRPGVDSVTGKPIKPGDIVWAWVSDHMAHDPNDALRVPVGGVVVLLSMPCLYRCKAMAENHA